MMSLLSRPIRSNLMYSRHNPKKSAKMNLCHVLIPKVPQKDNNMFNCIHQLNLIEALQVKRATATMHSGGLMTVQRVKNQKKMDSHHGMQERAWVLVFIIHSRKGGITSYTKINYSINLERRINAQGKTLQATDQIQIWVSSVPRKKR